MEVESPEPASMSDLGINCNLEVADHDAEVSPEATNKERQISPNKESNISKIHRQIRKTPISKIK